MPEKHDLLAAILAAEQKHQAILTFLLAQRGRYNGGRTYEAVIDAAMCAIIA